MKTDAIETRPAERWKMLNLAWVAFFLTFVVWYNLGAFSTTIARVLHLTVETLLLGLNLLHQGGTSLLVHLVALGVELLLQSFDLVVLPLELILFWPLCWNCSAYGLCCASAVNNGPPMMVV